MKSQRMTNQRRVILEELCQSGSHPTAADLYEHVRKRLPQISLGTVYRNLELLAKSGTIMKLDGGARGARFDPELHQHQHVRCMTCGRIDDVAYAADNDAGHQIGRFNGWQISERRVELFGTCPECLQGLKESEMKKNDSI